jgi:NAD(P)H dehydrogenase (quinone)
LQEKFSESVKSGQDEGKAESKTRCCGIKKREEKQAMKYLVIYSHPNPQSFCHAILETVKKTLAAKKHDVVVRDLYALGFDPVLKAADFAAIQSGKTCVDIKPEQDYIVWSDIMTIIHPIWWAGQPAMIKGYIDRVFSYGFAYSRDAKGIDSC